MFCPQCGSPIKDGQKFCPACGCPVGGQPTDAKPVSAAQGKRPSHARPASAPQKKRPAPKKKGMKLGLLIGLIVAGVVLVAALVTLFLLQPWKGWSDQGYADDSETFTFERKKDRETEDEKDSDGHSKTETETKTEAAPAEEARRPETETAPAEEPVNNPFEGVGSYNITVWVNYTAADLTRKQIEDFNKTNAFGIRFNATVEQMSEYDAAMQMITDAKAGADIFCFSQDQLARLVLADALVPLDGEVMGIVREANDPGAVASATLNDVMYAYPLTSDNGYFMYYDKTVIPEADVDSLEKLIADCEAAGKYFAFETDTSAWYIASWFFATGCKSEWVVDEDGQFISVTDDFNSEKGLIAVKGMKKLVDSPCHISSSSCNEFNNNAAIVVSGIWDVWTAQSILGDRMGATDLPSFTVDGKSYHLGSFNGCKLLGVKPQSDPLRLLALQLLCEYLTDETCQMERFNQLSWGPSNLKAQQSDAVQNDPVLSALLKQNRYSRPQGQIHGAWWDIGRVIGEDVKSARNPKELQWALDNYYDKLCALFDMTQAEKAAWGVIGCICGTNWDTDFPMTEMEPGVFRSERLTLHKGEEFKVRQGGSWDVNYGWDGRNGSNVVVDKDGNYYVWFNSSTGDIWLEKQ